MLVCLFVVIVGL